MGTVPPVFEEQSGVLGASHPHRVAHASRNTLLLAHGRGQMSGRNCRSCRVRTGEEKMVYSRLEDELNCAGRDRNVARAISTAVGGLLESDHGNDRRSG